MSLQRFLTIHTFVLLVCMPVWSQAFGRSVSGRAGIASCGAREYKETGVHNSTGAAFDLCYWSKASAESTADLDRGSQGQIGWSVYPFGPRPVVAGSQAMTFDPVTLIPPSAFNGDQVTFKMVDTYTTAGDAHVTVCWTIPNLVNDCVTVTSTVKGTFSKPMITLHKSTSGFQFRVAKAMAGDVYLNLGAGTASYTTPGDPDFKLPTGWTCRFASGRPCQ